MVAFPGQRNGTFAICQGHHHDAQMVREFGFVHKQHKLLSRVRDKMTDNPTGPGNATLLNIYASITEEALDTTFNCISLTKCPQIFGNDAQSTRASENDAKAEKSKIESLPLAERQMLVNKVEPTRDSLVN